MKLKTLRFNDKCFRLNVLQYGKPKTEYKLIFSLEI